MKDHGVDNSRLTVLYRVPNKNGKVWWHCKCECGNELDIRGDQITRGIAKSCGCLQKEIARKNMVEVGKNNANRPSSRRVDITGQRFGKLIVLYPGDPAKMGHGLKWYCKCDCGNIVLVETCHLKEGHTQSCGCLRSKGELKITQLLEESHINYKTQYTFPDLYFKSSNILLRFDFAIFNDDQELICLIEFQGPQHYDILNKWYSEEGILRDQKKVEYCKKHNIKLVQIPYTEYQLLTKKYLEEKINQCQE